MRRAAASVSLRLLNRFVLRPSRHAIDPGELIRCVLPSTGRWNLETFVATDLNPDRVEKPDAATAARPDQRPRGIPGDRPTTVLDKHWSSIPCPRHLVLKFPGTAGRAERSSIFPLNLVRGAGTLRDFASPGEHREAWVWNPPGYGRSGGRAHLANLASAATQFARQVAAARCDEDTIVWLCGNSLGCLPAIALASTHPDWLPAEVDPGRLGLWIRNPPELKSIIHSISRRYYGLWLTRRITPHLPADLDPLRNAAAAKVRCVFLMSELDSLVPPAVQRRIHSAYAGENRVVTLHGLEHDDVVEEQHLGELLRAAEWLIGRDQR